MRDRIRPPAELEETVLDRLKADGLIDTKQKGMMLAAAIGYHLDGRHGRAGKELEKAGEGIRLEYFQTKRDDVFIDALAVTLKGDLHALEDELQEERLATFEQLAHAGLLELKRVCYTGSTKPLDGLLDLIDRTINQTSSDLPGLEDLGDLEGLF